MSRMARVLKPTNSKTFKFSISGLRGIYGKDITPENIPLFCSAFHKCLSSGSIAIARDTRNTGEAMKQMVMGSLASLGRQVIDLGIVPTPTLKAYTHMKKLAGALMISASHNPMEYNALKLIKKYGLFFEEVDNKKFLTFLNQKTDWSLKRPPALKEAHQEAIHVHIEEVLNQVKLPKKIKMRVAVDTLGACATKIATSFLEQLGITVFSLYPHFLDKFPRKPEPTQDALGKLAFFTKKNKCDVGFAFDPDADRLAIVLPSGKALSEEHTLPLASLEALHHRKGDVVVNLSSSWLNQWVVEEFGRKLHRSKVGEGNVVHLMKRRRSEWGGEGNGGIIDMKIVSQGRDSLSGMAWILALLVNQNQHLDKIIDKMPKQYIKKIAIRAKNKDFLEKTKRSISKKAPEFQLNEKDGLHFSHKEGIPWLHIRSSNTEPMVRVIAEARDEKSLQQIFSLVKG